MKKFLQRLFIALAVAALPIYAIADYTATQGAGTTVFSFICSSTKICPATVLIDSTNTEKATAGNPLRVDPVGTTTQPVSAASLPLPAGASTSANQPTNAAIASTTSGQTGTLMQGAVTTGAPTYTTAQTDPLSLDTSGNLRVNCTTGCSSSGGSSLADEGTFTQGTTSFTAIGGIFNTGITNLTSGQAGAVQLTNDRNMFVNMNKWGGNVITGTVNAVGTVGSGNVPTINEFIVGCVSTVCNSNGQATMANSSPVVIASNQSAVPVGPVSLGTSGGLTPKRLSALSTTVTGIKASAAGQLMMLQCGNTNASEEYVQLFDVATTGGVTLGTTAPTLSVPIAATTTGGFTLSITGLQFANGIQVAATTTATGSTAPATALDCNAAFN